MAATYFTGFFLISGLFALFGFLIFVVTSIFWIFMLVDCIKNRALNDTEKLIWALVILFTHFLGAIIYFVVGRKT